MNNVISFSGGKYSTAMALMMLEKEESIHSVVAFDTGWEFPEMLEHWDKFERYTGLEIIRIYPKQPFNYCLFDRPVKKKGTDDVYRYGNGFPAPMRRWCTREKVNAIQRYLKRIDNHVSCVGFAVDEIHRALASTSKKYPKRYPLIEWGIDEKEALAICKRHGFDWGGLYEHFTRVSCWCCPLQKIGDLRTIYNKFPHLWRELQQMESRCTGYNPGFRGYTTVADLTARFQDENRQLEIFNT